MKTIQLYLSDLKELLQARDFVSARTCLKAVSPVDLAEGWEHFAPEERVALFRLTPRQRAVQLFEELDPHQQIELINSLQRQDAERLLQELDPAETGRLARQLPQPMVRQLVGIMKKGGQESVQKYLQFPPQTVGALMRGRYLTLDPRWSARQALERIQLSTRLRRIEETYLDTLMVVDEGGGLLGIVGLKFLVVAPRDMLVRELMDSSPRTLSPEMDQEEAVKLFTKYKLKSAPVLGSDNQLMGIVVYRDIFEVASLEVEEDFAKMAGVRAAPGARTSLDLVRLRLPWLVITCIGGLGVSSVIRHFEATLAEIIALATFSPLIAGMGGNAGSQTATVVVRGLATGEIKSGEERRTILREMAVGAQLGLFYALVLGLAAFLFYGTRYGPRFSVVVGCAMFISMFTAATLASTWPFLLRRYGLDPATATGPLITTTTDLLSNTVYFSLATYLLSS